MTTLRRAMRIAPRWGVLISLLAIVLFFTVPVKYLPFGTRLGPALPGSMSQIYLIGYMALICAAVVLVCKYAPESPQIDNHWEARNRAIIFIMILAPVVGCAYAIPKNLAGSGLLVGLAQVVGIIGSVIIVIRGYKVVSAFVLVGLFLGGCMYIVNGHW